jgi:AAA+ ATPase superfamily predicted ATPase
METTPGAAESAFVDRDAERAELRELLARGRPQLALLYGRRRVGKTHLLKHIWPARTTFHFTAANTTPEQNRRQLIADAAEWGGDSLREEDYPNWRTVFRMLMEFKAPEPLVIILDEFQYLGSDAASLSHVASELNAVWEQRRPPRALVLVLSGSSIGMLESLNTGAAPLYGRFAWHEQLRPFDYWYTARMASFRSLRDRALAYGIYGGTPHYLSTLRIGQPLARSVERAILSPRGEMRLLLETAMVQEEGLREPHTYTGLLRAIGAGYTELNGIGQRTGLPVNTALREKIERLATLGYVEAQRNFAAGPKEPYRYRVADPAFMFYHEFVVPHETLLTRLAPPVFWSQHVLPRLDVYMGHAFERIAEQAYVRAMNGKHLPLAKAWGRWEGKDREGAPIEIDLVAALDDGRTLTGGIKWNRRPLAAEVFTHHLRMLDRLAAAGMSWAHQAREPGAPILFVAAGGFSSGFQAAARVSGHPVTLWALKDLYGHRLR